MRAEINQNGELTIYCDESYDICANCINKRKCPLIQAISQEIVILHYSDVAIGECGLYKRK